MRPKGKKMPYYIAYGLGIDSSLYMPEFQPGHPSSEVSIRLGGNKLIPSEIMTKDWYVDIAKDKALFSVKGAGVFWVKEGREIIVIPAPNVEERLIRLFIIGPLLATLLYQRGLLVLHASAVEINGNVCAFMGSKGAGKSSLAAAFYSLGFSVLTDDNLPVADDNNAPRVFPGLPMLRLSPNVASSLGRHLQRQSDGLHNDREQKPRFCIADRFSDAPLPLRRAYVIEQGASERIELLGSREAFLELVRHSFPTRLSQPSAVSHFNQCASLVKRIPVFRLKRSSKLSELPELVKLIEEHQKEELP
jgi:hypothetical protein